MPRNKKCVTALAPTHFLHSLQRKHLRLFFTDFGRIVFAALVQSYKFAVLDFARSQQLDLLFGEEQTITVNTSLQSLHYGAFERD